jgi:hypothetical protein
MMRPGLCRRARVAIALSAAAGAIIVPVVIADAGSAWGPPQPLRLVATAQQGVGFAPTASRRKATGSAAARRSPAIAPASSGRCAR